MIRPLYSIVTAAALLSWAASAKAAPVTWQDLAMTPGALSAINAAREMLGTCNVPVSFEEQRTEKQITITVTCSNTGDGAGSIAVIFEKWPSGWFAQKFEFLG